MILELDIGNTRSKWRLLDADNLSVLECGSRTNADGLDEDVERWKDVKRMRVSSVLGVEATKAVLYEVAAALGVSPELAKVGSAAAGVVNSYADPERLGVDRWLAMIAAYNQLEGPVLVFDAGSALTVDMVDASGRHRGGYIIPGQRLMLQSLLHDTDRVRFGHYDEQGVEPGTSTEAAVHNGVLVALAGAAKLALGVADDVLGSDYSVVVTGGDANLLASHFSREFLLNDSLVLDGLRYVLP